MITPKKMVSWLRRPAASGIKAPHIVTRDTFFIYKYHSILSNDSLVPHIRLDNKI
jgi:hypothetical protein